jgi:hypothetical protein
MELMPHGIARDSVDAGVQALEAGVDVDMVSGIYVNTLAPAVRSGRLHEKEVNEAVRRILRAKWDLGLFHDPYRYGSPEAEEEIILSEENRELAREAATESMVLLKNEGDVLPLSKDAGTVAVIGPLANDARTILGEWAGAGRAEDAVSLFDGIREALDGRSNVRYAAGLPSSTSSDTTGLAEAVETAEAADAVVLVLGEPYDYSGEAASRTSLRLPGRQQALADSILSTGTPTATVLLNGRPLAIPHLAEKAPAILEAWYPGTEAGPAVADLVFGDAVPSGKLPVSIPRNVGQVPIYYNHVSTGRPPKAETDYTSRYLNTPWTALFPFGHGLSYTTFAYDDPRVSADSLVVGDTLTVTVDLTNTGDRTGTEVAALRGGPRCKHHATRPRAARLCAGPARARVDEDGVLPGHHGRPRLHESRHQAGRGAGTLPPARRDELGGHEDGLLPSRRLDDAPPPPDRRRKGRSIVGSRTSAPARRRAPGWKSFYQPPSGVHHAVSAEREPVAVEDGSSGERGSPSSEVPSAETMSAAAPARRRSPARRIGVTVMGVWPKRPRWSIIAEVASCPATTRTPKRAAPARRTA